MKWEQDVTPGGNLISYLGSNTRIGPPILHGQSHGISFLHLNTGQPLSGQLISHGIQRLGGHDFETLLARCQHLGELAGPSGHLQSTGTGVTCDAEVGEEGRHDVSGVRGTVGIVGLPVMEALDGILVDRVRHLGGSKEEVLRIAGGVGYTLSKAYGTDWGASVRRVVCAAASRSIHTYVYLQMGQREVLVWCSGPRGVGKTCVKCEGWVASEPRDDAIGVMYSIKPGNGAGTGRAVTGLRSTVYGVNARREEAGPETDGQRARTAALWPKWDKIELDVASWDGCASIGVSEEDLQLHGSCKHISA